MKQIPKIVFIFFFFLISANAFSQKVQIKAMPHIQPKINIPKVTKVHANSNSIIVPGGNIKTDKKEEITEPPVKDVNNNKKKKKKDQ